MDFNNNLFEKSKNIYERTNKKMYEMAKEFAKIAQGNGVKYDPLIACDLLDVILQFSMLQIVIWNNEITDNQFAYMSNMVVSKDLPDYLAHYTKEEVSWKVFKELGVINLRKFIAGLEPDFLKLSDHLKNVIVYNDYTIENKYYPIFESDMEEILLGVEKMEEKITSRKTLRDTVIYKVIYNIKKDLNN